MDEVKLLPCPFCGSEAESHRDGWYFVKCASEECLIDGPVGRTEAEAIAAWNTRAAVGDEWRTIESAPKDGTLVLLLVDYSDGDHWIDDQEDGLGRTIGHNNDDNVLPDEAQGWQFSGWCQTHEHYVEGAGRPIKWQPLPKAPDVTEKEKGE